MRQAEDAGPGSASATEGQGASPIKVGAAVLAVALGAWGLLWLTMRPDEPASQRTKQGPAFALTDAEALERFTELSHLSVQAIQSRDLTILPQVYTSNSPIGRDVRQEIDRLIHDDVIDKAGLETIKVELVSNGVEEIRIRETVVLRPCFVTEGGKDITRGPGAIEQISVWSLRQENSKWLVYDATLESDRVLGGNGACP